MKAAFPAFVAIVAFATTAIADDNPYHDKDGRLRQELVLIDSQGGFAGFSGQRWTIEPDGAWQRQPFLNRPYT